MATVSFSFSLTTLFAVLFALTLVAFAGYILVTRKGGGPRRSRGLVDNGYRTPKPSWEQKRAAVKAQHDAIDPKWAQSRVSAFLDNAKFAGYIAMLNDGLTTGRKLFVKYVNDEGQMSTFKLNLIGKPWLSKTGDAILFKGLTERVHMGTGEVKSLRNDEGIASKGTYRVDRVQEMHLLNEYVDLEAMLGGAPKEGQEIYFPNASWNMAKRWPFIAFTNSTKVEDECKDGGFVMLKTGADGHLELPGGPVLF